jgi:ABC-type phosphate transport system substrate-binding protein
MVKKVRGEYKITLILYWGDNVKVIYKFLLCLVIIIITAIGYVQYKFITTENEVMEYLTVNKKLQEESIKTKPFIANLSGDKNWMVSVMIKEDNKKYYYYLNNEGKVVLESIVENGTENVFNKIMN